MTDTPRPRGPVIGRSIGTFVKRVFLGTHVSVVLATLVSAGLLAFVADLASQHNSAGRLWTILRQTWLLVFVLTIPYLAARALVWQELLSALKVKTPLRSCVTAFAAGEITKTLPGGLYVQNYLLARLESFDKNAVARSSMATTAMLGLEAAIALPVALIFQLPGQPWIAWALIGVVIVWLALLFLAWMVVHQWGRDHRDRLPRWLDTVRGLLEDFLAAGGELLRPRTLRLLFPVALYLFLYALELYAILRAVGINHITFGATLGIFALIVMVDLLVPIPTEIGLTELTGLGALLAYNVGQSRAAIVVIGLRILATGMTVMVSILVLLAARSKLIGERIEAVERRFVGGG